jgi:hypothetical protein
MVDEHSLLDVRAPRTRIGALLPTLRPMFQDLGEW